MNLLVEAREFVSRNIVEVVEESDTAFDARIDLPGIIEAEMYSFEEEIVFGRSANPDLIVVSLERDMEALASARENAMRPRQMRLEWKILKPLTHLPFRFP